MSSVAPPSGVETDTAAAPEPAANPRRRRLIQVLTDSTAVIFLVLLALLAVFSFLRPDAFASVNTFRNIAIGTAGLLVLAVGMTFVIITAGIDLSVGSVLVFSGVVAVKAMAMVGGGQGWSAVLVGVAAALVAGLGWGLLNGFLIAKANIPAFIVTLGTFGSAQGAALLLTGGVDQRGVPRELVTTVGTGRLLGQIPWLVVLALTVAVCGGVVLRYTRFGRYTYAIGSNAEAARRVGINVDRHLIKIYALAGTLAGLSSIVNLARFTNTTLQGHATDNLQAIAAVVIGGTSLFGGIGGMFGTVVGVLIPSVLTYGFVILRVQPFWQMFAVGVVLVAAVYVDQLKRSARARL